MTVKHLTLCNSCIHYAGDGTCVAFPDAIPDDILRLAGDHRSHVAGDHGITFQSSNTQKAKQNLAYWMAAHSE